jgi:hypothetical protein
MRALLSPLTFMGNSENTYSYYSNPENPGVPKTQKN